MKTLPIVLLLLVLMLPFASAGTLISGSKVDVESNYAGFSGLSLVGTWSTTPSVSDSIVIKTADVEAPYTLQTSATINIPAPLFEQVLRVNTQLPLIKGELVQKRYWYINYPGFGKTASQICNDAVSSDLATTYSGRQLYPSTGINANVGNIYCDVIMVLQQSHAGWMGPVDQDHWNYNQKIVFSTGQTLNLVSNTQQTQVVDKIDNFARASLVNFGQWTSSQLTDNNIYGYHKKSALGTDVWHPFQDTTGLGTYQTLYSFLTNNFAAGDLSSADFDSTRVAEYQRQVTQMNSEIDRLTGSAITLPSGWTSTGDLNGIHYSANDIIVPIKKTVLVANIQLVLKGDQFGLYIPTGKPQIVSSGSTLTFPETGSGVLSYTIKNIGTATGTFQVTSTCSPSGIVQADPVFHTLTANTQITGQLYHTAKTDITSDQIVGCTLRLTETNTQEYVTRTYTVTVQAKQSCVQGQQTDPVLTGTTYTVKTLDTQCNVINSVTCDALTGVFQKQNGIWVCVGKDPTTGTNKQCNDGVDNDQDGKIDYPQDPGCSEGVDDNEKDLSVSVTLMVISAIVAALIALLVFSFLPSILDMRWRVMIAIVIFVGFFFVDVIVIKYIVKAFTEFFSL